MHLSVINTSHSYTRYGCIHTRAHSKEYRAVCHHRLVDVQHQLLRLRPRFMNYRYEIGAAVFPDSHRKLHCSRIARIKKDMNCC